MSSFEGSLYETRPATTHRAADGTRFLMLHEAPRGAPRLNVIQGWQRLGIGNAVANR